MQPKSRTANKFNVTLKPPTITDKSLTTNYSTIPGETLSWSIDSSINFILPTKKRTTYSVEQRGDNSLIKNQSLQIINRRNKKRG